MSMDFASATNNYTTNTCGWGSHCTIYLIPTSRCFSSTIPTASGLIRGAGPSFSLVRTSIRNSSSIFSFASHSRRYFLKYNIEKIDVADLCMEPFLGPERSRMWVNTFWFCSKPLFFNSLSYHYLVFSHGIQANHLSTAETKPNQQTKPFKLQKY